MSLSVIGDSEVGQVKAFTTSGRGLTPEEIVEELVLPKLMNVAETAGSGVKEQAEVFKARIRALLVRNMYQAIKSDRTTLKNKLDSLGQKELADLILHL